VNKKLTSLYPLLTAGMFMLIGTMFLVWLGRDQSRIINQPMGSLDLQPLIAADEAVDPHAWEEQVLVVHFWGTWCPPCREEYPEFAKLHDRLKDDKRIRFISVSCSPGMEKDMDALRDSTAAFLESLDVDMPIYADTTAFTRSHVARLMASKGMGYPTTLIVDRQGMIRDAWVGMANMPKLEKAIKRVADQPLEKPASK
jgi:thiol-disulfide isomerase/thioredoxin